MSVRPCVKAGVRGTARLREAAGRHELTRECGGSPVAGGVAATAAHDVHDLVMLDDGNGRRACGRRVGGRAACVAPLRAQRSRGPSGTLLLVVVLLKPELGLLVL